MGLSGIPSCIIRFICHIPSGMGGIGGMAQYNKIKDFQDVLEVIPHGKDYLLGLKIDSHVVSCVLQFPQSPAFGPALLAPGRPVLADATVRALVPLPSIPVFSSCRH